ncbi:1-deoxy-D-xylulose-5-phosphate reductoisomerase [Polycladidibacter hongkongensis]|uniref:1-deoxy-D-xylulose-5-phosphate reductoisomerase n=1 Tax=Polycladidibacter hongkongensis TaxID=1647556 RepID=UPI000836D896|nr:1-deoxy-D-xylulose-5-phosphate reductoisomerase [Pseudovibrio hongkongensis]
MAQQRIISLFGSTGSIGCSSIDLLQRDREFFAVDTLVAYRNVALLAEQALACHAKLAVIGDESLLPSLQEALAGSGIEVAGGRGAVLEAAARPVDLMVSALVGAAGLEPTLCALGAGVQVALANKESLVCAGHLVKAALCKAGKPLLPVDSEHNAIFQVFEGRNEAAVEKLVLTASGGPFRTLERAQMADVTPAQALKHPNWDMGQRISIDSATMVNKGLEFIEALHLFPVSVEQVEVLVHPQSLIHSMVQYRDGSMLAQLGTPDMRIPISYCLNYPQRGQVPAQRLDLAQIGQMTFEAPDESRFPALALARQVAQLGDGAGTAYNGADEVAVAAFLQGQIGFLRIVDCIEHVLNVLDKRQMLVQPERLEDVLGLDGEVRKLAGEYIANTGR